MNNKLSALKSFTEDIKSSRKYKVLHRPPSGSYNCMLWEEMNDPMGYLNKIFGYQPKSVWIFGPAIKWQDGTIITVSPTERSVSIGYASKHRDMAHFHLNNLGYVLNL